MFAAFRKIDHPSIRRRVEFLAGSAIVVLLFTFSGVALAAKSPKSSIEVTGEVDRVSTATSIRIHFDRPVSRAVDATISPDILGSWSFDDPVFGRFLTRTVTFTPVVTLSPDTAYVITLTGVRNGLLLNGSTDTVQLSFRTEPAPKVMSVVPSDVSPKIAPTSTFTVTLDGPNNGSVVHEFRFSPSLEVDASLAPDRRSYTVVPRASFQQGATYQLTVLERKAQVDLATGQVVRQGEPTVASVTSWETLPPPGIAEVGPTGDGVDRGSALTVTFSETMDRADVRSNLRVEPAVSGRWETTDGLTYRLTPSRLAAGTTYVVTIPAGTKTSRGGFIEADSTFTFTTKGPVRLLTASPSDGSTGVSPSAKLSFTFDQTVDPTSVSNSFILSPEVAGKLDVDGATARFTPDDSFPRDAAFTVTWKLGLTGEEGIPSSADVVVRFTTERSVVRISVPSFRQERNLSCEAAALRMALAAKGVTLSEREILAKIGVDPTKHTDDIWGDPHVAFVGNVDGRQPTTGYGVYWEPIARVASIYRKGRAFTGGTVQLLTAEIANGNPVIVWGNATTGRRIDWVTPSGKKIVSINGEHTRTVKGFVGPAGNPTSIIVNDPLYGERIFSRAAFEADWSLLGRSGVVVE